mgnify:CR=1 FL=1
MGLPGILSKIIDGLGKQTVTWLVAFILFFLAMVVVKGFATVLNSYLSEKMGRSVCDEIRKELLKKSETFLKRSKATSTLWLDSFPTC